MDHPAGEPVRLQWMLVADLMSLLFLVSLGFVDPRAIAQEVVGQAPQRMAMDPTVFTSSRRRHRRQSQTRISRSARAAARR